MLRVVNDRSYAGVVCEQIDAPARADVGKVVRWHLDDVPWRVQRQLLDVDVLAYFETLEREEETRCAGFLQLERLADDYHSSHDEGKAAARA